MRSEMKWRKAHWGHLYGNYRLRVHTNTVDGKGPMYTLSKAIAPGNIVRITFDGESREYHAENTCMRDLRNAKRAVEALARADEELKGEKE